MQRQRKNVFQHGLGSGGELVEVVAMVASVVVLRIIIIIMKFILISQT